jgi:C-terminal processing protease CtpA/Prc
MRRLKIGLLSTLVLVLAVPAFAGDADKHGEKKKCPASAQECLDQMTTRFKNTGWIGVELEISEETPGYLVRNVVPGSPAAKAGLEADDILWAFEGNELSSENEGALKKLRQERMKVGSTVSYVVKREGKEITVKITLEPWPADLVARYVGEHMLEHAATEIASAGN